MNKLTESPQEHAVSKSAFWITFAIIGVLFVGTIYNAMPRNILSSGLTEAIKYPVYQVWPQGWGFFTKDPDDSEWDAYSKSAEDEVSLLETPPLNPGNLYGLSRTSRAQGVEMAFINQAIDKHQWKDCGSSRTECMNIAWKQPVQSVSNDSPIPSICGDIVMTSEETTPWAYRNIVDEDHHLLKTAHLKVNCKDGE